MRGLEEEEWVKHPLPHLVSLRHLKPVLVLESQPTPRLERHLVHLAEVDRAMGPDVHLPTEQESQPLGKEGFLGRGSYPRARRMKVQMSDLASGFQGKAWD
jgi:hypothetical protein